MLPIKLIVDSLRSPVPCKSTNELPWTAFITFARELTANYLAFRHLGNALWWHSSLPRLSFHFYALLLPCSLPARDAPFISKQRFFFGQVHTTILVAAFLLVVRIEAKYCTCIMAALDHRTEFPWPEDG